MIKLIDLLLICSLFMVVSCTSETDKEIELLNAELTKGHDDVMPKSMRLGDLKSDVLEKAKADTAISTEAVLIANQLQATEDAMYKWMDEYSVAMNDIPDKAEKLTRYRKLKGEINVIQTNTNEIVQQAETFIKK